MGRIGRCGRVAVAVGILVAIGVVPGSAQNGEAAPSPSRGGPVDRIEFEVRPARSEISVDGDLSEPAWLRAETIPLRWETSPGENTPAPVSTECRVTFDEENLYFGCEARDADPSAIRAFVTDRDELGEQDHIVFAVDPFNDSRRAMEFLVNPLGVQGDRFYDEQRGRPDDSWNAIWASAGRIVEDGYRVEAAVPFRSLRFPDDGGEQTWGVHFRRVWPRSERVQMRSLPLDQGDGCLLCQANRVTGIAPASPGRNVEMVPTFTATRSDEVGDAGLEGGLEAGPIHGEAGVSMRWSPSTDVTLNAALNPDFSQVEADAAQLDVNRRFALFFAERRPFFLEGADLFRTPIRAVFTRTIADPVGGAKITGKSGGWAGGVLVARDRINNLLFPGNQRSARTSLDQRVTSTVGRFRRDIGESSTVGGLYTGRVGAGGYYNHVGGVDAFLRPFPSVGVRVQYLHSETRYPDQVAREHDQAVGGFGGGALEARAEWETRRWALGVDFSRRDRGFRADAGFVPRVDVRRMGVDVGHTIWGDEDGWFTRIRTRVGARRNETLGGRLNEQTLWSYLSWSGPLQSNVWLNPHVTEEFFSSRRFRLPGVWGGASIRPNGRLELGVSGRLGSVIDVANVRQADGVRVSPRAELRIGRGTRLTVEHTLQRLSLDGEEIFLANLTELRAVHNFTPRAFARATFQYRKTDRNPALNADEVDPSRSSLFTQLLLSYKVNPLTAVFIGYTDERAGFVNARRNRTALSPAGRTFFFKIGYAWRP